MKRITRGSIGVLAATAMLALAPSARATIQTFSYSLEANSGWINGFDDSSVTGISLSAQFTATFDPTQSYGCYQCLSAVPVIISYAVTTATGTSGFRTSDYSIDYDPDDGLSFQVLLSSQATYDNVGAGYSDGNDLTVPGYFDEPVAQYVDVIFNVGLGYVRVVSHDVDVSATNDVAEPSAAVLLTLPLIGLAAARRFRRAQRTALSEGEVGFLEFP